MPTTITTDQVSAPAKPPRAGLWQALASEFTKLYSVRSNLWTLVAMAASIVGIAVLVAATGSLNPADSVLAGSLANAVPGQIAAGILGALVVCGEYSSGTIRPTLAACPRRLTVLAAKVLMVTGLVFVAALAASVLAYLAGTVLLAGQRHPAGEPVPALAGIALSFAVVGALGVAAGTALRHPAGAVTAVTGLIVLPALLAPLLGDWQQWVVGASPVAALQKLAQPVEAADQLGTLAAWPTLAVVYGYTMLALAGSAWLLRTRDS